ncbi:hypothetical protein [Catellatospora tritici]|uniref:hypothetical protein n=1 Tax=Catellatospora tritici TaxID=2851566 RepID=UPI001C2DB79E|nr:hypothetical protein [Catellatospora tritici]MBV1854510.1 hypothetical protein [Catellatospora tritici]
MRNPLRALHPRQFRGMRLLLLVTALAVAAMVGGTTLLDAEFRGVAMGVLLAAGLIGGWFAVTGFRPLWTAAAGLIGFLLVVSVLVETGPSLLQLRGGRVEARVTAVREAGSSQDRYHYTLTTPGWRPVSGELTSGEPRYRVGDPVTVVEDPNGLADPMLPSELTEHRQSWLALIVLYLVTAVLCLLAGRPRPAADAPHAGARRSRRRKAEPVTASSLP